MELSNKILSDITVYMKYAKYIPELNRRETWEELVTRNKNIISLKHSMLSIGRYAQLYTRLGDISIGLPPNCNERIDGKTFLSYTYL